MKLEIDDIDTLKNSINTTLSVIGTVMIATSIQKPEQLHGDPIGTAIMGTLMITAGIVYAVIADGQKVE